MEDKQCQYYHQSIYTICTTDHRLLCALCATYCEKLGEDQVKQAIVSANTCECSRHDTHSVAAQVQTSLKSHELSLDHLVANNQFLRNFKDNMIETKPSLNYIFMQVSLIRKEIENRTFFWENINDTSIKEIIGLFLPFCRGSLSDHPLSSKHRLLESSFMEEVASLEFILQLTNFTTSLQGTSIYDRSQDFYTMIYGIVDTYHFQHDFQGLERIDAEFIHCTTPLYRQNVRHNNMANQYIRQKYFDGPFDIRTLLRRSIDVLLPASDTLYVTCHHRHHVYVMKLAKTLAEYGLLKEQEMDELLQIMAGKVQNLVQLEKTVQSNPKYRQAGYLKSFQLIREYVCEFAIHLVYQIQDGELEMNLRRGSDGQGHVNREYQYEWVSSRIYQSSTRGEEVHQKLIDIILGQVISSTTFSDGRSLVTDKVSSMADNFIMMFASVNDPYQSSLQLMTSQEIKDYLCMCSYGSAEVLSQVDAMDQMLIDLKQGKYALSIRMLTTSLMEQLDNLDQLIKYKGFELISAGTNPRMKANQHALLFLGYMTKLFLVLTLVHDSLDQDCVQPIYEDVCDLLRFMGHDNSQFLQWMNLPQHSSVLSTLVWSTVPRYYLTTRHRLTLLSPKNLVKSPSVFINNHRRMLQDIENAKVNQEVQQDLRMLHLQFLRIHLEMPAKRISVFDVQIASLILEMYPQDLMADVLDPFVMLPDSSLHVEYLGGLINILTRSLSLRITSQCLDAYTTQIPLGSLIALIKSCDKLEKDTALEKQSALTSLLDVLYGDPKDKLMDSRPDYVFQTERYDDPQVRHVQTNWNNLKEYVEDPLYDCGQNNLFLFLSYALDNLQQTLFVADRSLQYKAKDYYFGVLLPMTYRIVVRLYHQRNLLLPRVAKYLSTLKKLNETLQATLPTFLETFQIKDGSAQELIRLLKAVQENNEKNLDNNVIKFMLQDIKCNLKTVLDYVAEMMEAYQGGDSRRWKKHRSGQSMNLFYKLNQYDTRLAPRKEHFENHVKKSLRKSHMSTTAFPSYQEIAVEHIVRQYNQFKVSLFSINQHHNRYLQELERLLNKTKCYNLMNYLYLKVNQPIELLMDPRHLNYHMEILGCMSQLFFFCTRPAQIALQAVWQNNPQGHFFLSLWQAMLRLVLVVKGKRQMDRFYKQSYEQTIMILKLLQFMMQQDNAYFKKLMGQTPIYPNGPSRLSRLTTIINQLCLEFNFHVEYKKDSLKQMATIDRPDLYYLATVVMQCINECISGTDNNRLVIFSFIGDKLLGLLNRYEENIQSQLYQLKNQIMIMLQFFVATYDPQIIHNVTINYELLVLNDIANKSIRQLYFQHVKGIRPREDELDDIGTPKWALNMGHYKHLSQAYRFDKTFQKSAILTFCLNVFILIKNISQNNTAYSGFFQKRERALLRYLKKGEMPIEFSEEELVAYRFISEIIDGIEVVDMNIYDSTRNSVILYYAREPKSQYLPNVTLEEFLENVDRSSAQHKLTSLVNQIEQFEIEMEYYQSLIQENNWFGRISEIMTFKGGFVVLRYLAFVLNLVINVLLLIFYTNDKTKGARDSFKQDKFNLVYLILGLINLFICLIGSLFFVYNEGNVQIRKFRLKLKNDKIDAIRERRFSNVFGWRKKMKEMMSLIKFGSVHSMEFFSKKDLMFVLIVIMLLLGLFLQPVFFCFSLLSITSLSQIILTMRQSVLNNIKQIMLTYCISLTFCYMYAFYIFKHYQADAQDNCNTLYQCFIQTVTIATRNGIGISELMKKESFMNPMNRSTFIGRYVLEISFWLIVNLVVLNILSGIIIDSFISLRANRQALQDDLSNECYICGFNKNLFDSYGVNFQSHIDQEHQIQKYVHFIIYMKNKNINDCTSQETKIYQSIMKKDIDWFPQHMCLSIKNLQDNTTSQEVDHNQISKVYSQFKQKITQLLDNDKALFSSELRLSLQDELAEEEEDEQ